MKSPKKEQEIINSTIGGIPPIKEPLIKQRNKNKRKGSTHTIVHDFRDIKKLFKTH